MLSNLITTSLIYTPTNFPTKDCVRYLWVQVSPPFFISDGITNHSFVPIFPDHLRLDFDNLLVLAKSTVRDTRVKYHILGFRLITGCLENALKGGIYSLLWAWISVAWFPSNMGICVFYAVSRGF